jgi:hypothetical protein
MMMMMMVMVMVIPTRRSEQWCRFVPAQNSTVYVIRTVTYTFNENTQTA